MTVFSLLTYSCLTVLTLGGDLQSKTCSWTAEQALFLDEGRCTDRGSSLVGSKVHSFSIMVGSDQRIEKFKCSPQHVE